MQPSQSFAHFLCCRFREDFGSWRKRSPSPRRSPPPGRRRSPPGRRISPQGRRDSPPGRSPPPGRRRSPAGRRSPPPPTRGGPWRKDARDSPADQAIGELRTETVAQMDPHPLESPGGRRGKCSGWSSRVDIAACVLARPCSNDVFCFFRASPSVQRRRFAQQTTEKGAVTNAFEYTVHPRLSGHVRQPFSKILAG